MNYLKVLSLLFTFSILIGFFCLPSCFMVKNTSKFQVKAKFSNKIICSLRVFEWSHILYFRPTFPFRIYLNGTAWTAMTEFGLRTFLWYIILFSSGFMGSQRVCSSPSIFSLRFSPYLADVVKWNACDHIYILNELFALLSPRRMIYFLLLFA